MFRNVPACSEMFRVPGFIDAHLTMTTAETRNQKPKNSVASKPNWNVILVILYMKAKRPRDL